MLFQHPALQEPPAWVSNAQLAGSMPAQPATLLVPAQHSALHSMCSAQGWTRLDAQCSLVFARHDKAFIMRAQCAAGGYAGSHALLHGTARLAGSQTAAYSRVLVACQSC